MQQNVNSESTIPPISNKQTTPSHLKQLNKKKEHMALEIQLLAWDRNTNEAGLTQIMGSQSPSNNWTPMTDINIRNCLYFDWLFIHYVVKSDFYFIL